MKKYLLHFFDINCCHAIGLLVLRIGVSASLMTHGYGKFMKMMQGDGGKQMMQMMKGKGGMPGM